MTDTPRLTPPQDDALWTALRPPGTGTVDVTDQHQRASALVARWLAETRAEQQATTTDVHTRIRQVLARFIDPDDDTMPYPSENGGYTWTPAGPVIDQLAALVDGHGPEQRVRAHAAANVPGSTAEQLPDRLLALLDLPPYTSTACQTADAIWAAAQRIPGAGAQAGALHARCRLNHKYTGQPCGCGCHRTDTDEETDQ